MVYLVTGCAGFIGWKVSERLLKNGDEVIGVDNLNNYYDPRLKEWRLGKLRDSHGFTFHLADVAQNEAMQEIFDHRRFDAVINLAARAGVRASLDNPWLYYDTNVVGTLNLLECCRRYKVDRFLLASSSSVYGLNTVPFKEEDCTDRVLSPYAASKKAAEVLCHTYHYLHGISTIILRYFTVYGPAGRPDMAYFKFMKSIDAGEPIEVYGDGKQTRDFTYVDDIASGTVSGLSLDSYHVINLGNNRLIELNRVIALLEKLLGKEATVRSLDSHSADVPATCADITRARELMGWEPRVGIEQGLKETVQWFLEHGVRLHKGSDSSLPS
jgi:UDP-glucuronate 4-epimerase